jgi:hypothetical protein
MYCQGRYGDAEIAANWMVNEWATVIAACWLCSRRGNPVPDSLKFLLKGDDGKGGAMADLEKVRSGRLPLPGAPTRGPEHPSFIAVTVNPLYRLKQIRIQPELSERVVAQHPTSIDSPAYFNER